MTITVRLFAILREQAGVSEFTLQLPAAATVATARAALVQQHPALADLIARVAFAVNRTYAPLDTQLRDGDEVAVIPPVSGG
jgi:molybdopterin converting factor subunit 1